MFFSLAQIAALPQVVSSDHLPQAYALDTTTEYIGALLGPSLGGFIIVLVQGVLRIDVQTLGIILSAGGVGGILGG